MRAAIYAAAVALAVVAMAPASAYAGWKIDWALAIAQHVWRPSCGQLSVRFGDPVANRAPADALEWAWEGDCEIGIRAGVDWEFEPLCQAILHGGGHVVGLGHSDNPRSVMRPVTFFAKTTATIGGRTVTRWDGIDRRCLRAGREHPHP